MTAATTTTTTAAADLLKTHAELVSARESAATDNAGPGKLAGLSRKLRLTEYLIEMYMIETGETVDYQPWNPPSAAVESLTDKTEQELWDMLATAKQTRLDAETSGLKASAMQTYKRIRHELVEGRGQTVEAFIPPRPGITPQLSDADLSHRVLMIEKLLASPRIRPSIKRQAEREHEALSNLMQDRGITTTTPETAPAAVSAADAMDAVNAEVSAAVDAKPRKRVKATATA
jgi:hypothetical protein